MALCPCFQNSSHLVRHTTDRYLRNASDCFVICVAMETDSSRGMCQLPEIDDSILSVEL